MEEGSKQAKAYTLCCCQNIVLGIVFLVIGIVLGITGSVVAAVGFGTRPADLFDTKNTSMRVAGLCLIGAAILALVLSLCCWLFYCGAKHRSKHAAEQPPAPPPLPQPVDPEDPAQGDTDPAVNPLPAVPEEQVPLQTRPSRVSGAQQKQLASRPPMRGPPTYPGSLDGHSDNGFPLKFLPQAESIETRSRCVNSISPPLSGSSFDRDNDAKPSLHSSGSRAPSGSGTVSSMTSSTRPTKQAAKNNYRPATASTFSDRSPGILSGGNSVVNESGDSIVTRSGASSQGKSTGSGGGQNHRSAEVGGKQVLRRQTAADIVDDDDDDEDDFTESDSGEDETARLSHK